MTVRELIMELERIASPSAGVYIRGADGFCVPAEKAVAGPAGSAVIIGNERYRVGALFGGLGAEAASAGRTAHEERRHYHGTR